MDFCTLWFSWKPFFICGFFSHPSDAHRGEFNPNVLWPLSTVAKQARRPVGRNHVLCVYADSSQEFTLWQTVELPVVWDMITFTWHNCNKLWTYGWFSNAYEITTIWLSHTDEFLSHPYATTTACLCHTDGLVSHPHDIVILLLCHANELLSRPFQIASYLMLYGRVSKSYSR